MLLHLLFAWNILIKYISYTFFIIGMYDNKIIKKKKNLYIKVNKKKNKFIIKK